MADKRIGFNLDFKANTKDVESNLNKLKQSLKKLQEIKLVDFKGNNKQLKEMQEKAQAVEKALTKAFNPTLNTVNIKAFQSQVEKTAGSIDQIYTSFSKAGAQGQVAFHQMSTQILTTNLQLKETHSLIDSMGKTMMNTVKWGIASSVMNTFTQSVQGAFSYVQSLQKSLTNIRIVTGDNIQQMAKFADQANKAAQGLGRSTLDYTKSSLTFYQQGLDDETVQARTEATLKAQNITGTGAQMADYLTSVWNGYKVANEQAQLYVDKLAAVADSSASDMSQLAIAMSKVSATANVLGVDVDQLAASIATVVATTRLAPESVGTAFKTIFARINDIKTGSDQAEISLGNYSGKMASLGINVLDATGHLRDTGEVMDEIGQKWATMTREQQIYLAQTMGGQRQITQVTALFDNWALYSELLNTSLQSQGTLNEKNARYMESLGAKMEQLGAAGERVKAALIDEEDVKDGISALTNLVNLIGSLIESIGGGKNALIAFGSIATQVFSSTIASEINKAIINFQNVKNNLQIKNDDIANTQALMQTEGYKKNIITELINAKREAQKYYDYMSQAQINQHNQLLTNIADAKQQLIITKERTDAAERFAKSYMASKTAKGNSFKGNSQIERLLSEDFQEISGSSLLTIQALQDKINDFSFKVPQEGLKELKNTYQDLVSDIGKKPIQSLNSFENYKTALNQIKDSANPTETEVRRVKRALTDLLKQANTKVTDAGALRSLMDQTDALQKKLSFAEKAQRKYLENIQQFSTIKTFVNMVAGLGQIAAGLTNIVNLTKIWKDTNLSSGEKILQTFTNLSMTLPMLVNGFTKTKEGFTLLLGKIVNMTAAQGAYTGATVGSILANQGLAAALQTVATNFYLAYGFLLPYIAAIGAVVAVVYGLYKAWNAEADAAAKANKVASDAKKSYEQLKNSADELKSSLDQLHEAQSNFDDLTKGTQQWKDALQEVNNQVLDLIAKYPELAQYVENINGRLSLNEQGEAEYLAKINEGVQNARNASQIAASQARNADTRAAAAAIGHEVINTGEGASNYGNATPWANADQVLKVTEGLDKAIQSGVKESGWVDAIVEQTDMDRELVSAILNQKEEVLQLRNQLQQNKTADQLLYQTMAQNELQNSSAYNNLDELGKAVADKFASTSLQQNEDLIQRQLRSKYGSISRLAGAGDEEVQQLLKDLNEVQGTNWGLASNAVQGNSVNRTFHFVDENGQEKTKTAEQIAQLIATTKALQKLGTSATDTANLLKQIDESGLNQNSNTGLKQFLASGNFDLTESELNSLNTQSLISELGDQKIEELAKASGYKTGEDFINAYQQAIINNQQAFKQIGQLASTTVQAALKDSHIENAVLSTQQDIENAYTKVFNQSGNEALNNLQNIFTKNGLDSTLVNLFANTDFTSIEGLNELQASLKSLGQESVLVTEDWIKFKNEIRNSQFENPIDSIFEQQGKLNSITGDIKQGSIISQEDLETLAAADEKIRDLFKRTAQGYQFVGSKKNLMQLIAGSVPDYIDAANRFDSIKETALAVQQELADFNTKNAVGSELAGATDKALNTIDGNEAAFAALGFSEDSLRDAKARIQEYLTLTPEEQGDEQLQKQYEADKEYLTAFLDTAQMLPETLQENSEAMRAAAALNAETLTELVGYLQAGQISGRQFAEALGIVSRREMENLGFDPQEYENFVKLLQATNEEYRENQYLARQVAQANMRISEGTQDLIDNWDKYNQAIQDYIASGGDISTIVDEWQNLTDTLANLFDMDQDTFDLLGPDFVANNLDKIQAVKDGVEGAYEQLDSIIRENLQKTWSDAIETSGETLDLLKNQDAKIYVDIDDGWIDQEVYDTQDKIFNALEEISNNADIEVGATVDDANLIAGLNNMIEASGLASDQMAAIFDAMGYDVEFEEKPGSIGQQTENTEYYIPPTYRMETQEGTLLTSGEPVTYSYPVLDQKADIGSVPAIKESAEPPAYAIKTITKNGKGTGGNISRKTANAPSNKKSSGGGKKGGGGGSSKAKTPKTAKGVTAKVDPYRTVNNALKRTSSQLEKVHEEQEKLAGKDLIDNLTKQQKILDEQVELYKEKLAIAKQERDTIASTLQQQGIGLQFDQNGTISNMEQALEQAAAKANAEIARYNRMSAEEQQQDANKNIAKNAETWFKNIQTLLSNYDKLTEDTIPDLEKTIADQLAKQLELNLEKFNLQVDLTLDAGQASRQYNEFKKQVIDKIADDDILGIDRYLQEDIKLYQAENQALDKHIEEIRERISNMQNGLFDSVYGNNINQAFEDLAKYTDKAVDNLKDIEDKIKDIRESVFDAIDKVEQAFDEQKEEYDYISDLIDHSRKLTEIRYGDDAYDLMEQLYERERENNNSLLEFQYGQTQLWYQKMLEARQNMNNATDEQDRKHWEKQFKEYEKLYIDSQNELNSKFEESIENIIDKYVNAINKVFDELEKRMTNGLGLGYLADEWDLINEGTDRYLDKVDALYEIDTLDNAYQEAIKNAEGNPQAQKSLNELMNTQLKYLRDKDKLTKYDVDRANALLDIEVKRLALENSRNNKSKLRLRRDSQGNYTYQYTADDSDVNKAEQDLAKARKDLYDMTRDSYKDNLEDFQSTLTQMENDIKDVMADATLSEEQRWKKAKMLAQNYAPQIKDILSNLEVTKGFLPNDMVDSLSASLHEAIQLSDDDAETLLHTIVPQMTSTLADAAKYVRDQGIEGLVNDMFEGYNLASEQLRKEMEQAERYVNQDLSELIKQTDAAILVAKDLLENNARLIADNQDFINRVNQQIAQGVQEAMTATNTSLADTTLSALDAAIAFDRLNASLQAAIMTLDPDYYNINTNRASGRDVNNVNKSVNDTLNSGMEIASGATGMYTGSWGSEGRLAILHEKELLLNKDDTKNMLSAINIVRAMDDLLNNIDFNNKILNSSIAIGSGANQSSAVDQNIHIEANFPNVSMQGEIEKAFEGLVNQAYQYAFNTKK